MRVVVVVSCSGLALTVAWYLITSALVTQSIIPTAFVVGAFAVGAAAVIGSLWFVPKAIRPIKVGQGQARIPGPLFRTTVVTSEDALFVWVRTPDAGGSDGFTPYLRMSSGEDLTLDLLAGPTEHGVLANSRKFARALGVERPVGSVAVRP